MIADALLVFSDRQSVTVTADSTNIVDQLAAGDPGRAAFLYIQVDTTFAAAGAATLTIALVTDDNSTFSSPTTLWSSAAVAVASLVATAGSEYELKIAIPRGAERYLKVTYTVATGPMTAGKISANIVLDVDLAV